MPLGPDRMTPFRCLSVVVSEILNGGANYRVDLLFSLLPLQPQPEIECRALIGNNHGPSGPESLTLVPNPSVELLHQ